MKPQQPLRTLGLAMVLTLGGSMMWTHAHGSEPEEDFDVGQCYESLEAMKDCCSKGHVKPQTCEKHLDRMTKILHTTTYHPQRCERDSLSIAHAHQRNKWTLECVRGTKEIVTPYLSEARPYYPTFEFRNEDGRGNVVWSNPKNYRAYPMSGDGRCDLPDGYYINSVCLSSCYTPDQQVLFPQGYVQIGVAALETQPQIVAVTENSTMDQIDYAPTDMDFFVKSDYDAWHEIITFETLAGRKLTVTTNHPLLVASGEMKVAKDLKVGDLLVGVDGIADPISAAIPGRYFGKVHNVVMKTRNPMENIVVAQDLLNGSAFYQNEGAYLVNRVLMRMNLSNALFDQQ